MGVTVLVVDDSPLVRAALRARLLSQGADEVHEASGALQAVDAIALLRPDLVFASRRVSAGTAAVARAWAVRLVVYGAALTSEDVREAMGQGASQVVPFPGAGVWHLGHLLPVRRAS